jgi:hypothetical protein
MTEAMMDSRSEDTPKYNVSTGDESIDTDAFVDSYAQVPLPKHIEPKFYDCQRDQEQTMSDTPERSRGPFTYSVSRQRFGETVCLENTIRDADGCTLIRQWYSSYAAGEYVEEIDLAPGDWPLFAAAPEMLNALIMVLDDPNALDRRPRTAEIVYSAIAKAEGRQG